MVSLTTVVFVAAIVDIQHLLRGGGDRAPADRIAAVPGGRKPDRELYFFPWGLQGTLYLELGKTSCALF